MIVSMDPNVQPWQIECERLRAENARLKGEVEQLSDVLKTSQLVANLKSFEKCAADLQRHKDALKEAKVALECCRPQITGRHGSLIHETECSTCDSVRNIDSALATINKVLGETEGK